MANKKQLRLFSLLFLVVFQLSYSQFDFTNEVGFFAGAYNLQSDFGEAQNFESTTNTGLSVGIAHYINFSYKRSYSYRDFDNYFNEHFKIKSEISWNRTNLKHYGTWVDASRTSDNAERLRSHTGEAQNFNIGTQLEFFPFEIRDFEGGVINILPFVAIGVQYVFYNPKVFTEYNGSTDINDLNNFYLPWQVDEEPFLSNEAGNTFSIVGSLGTRYKLSPLTDLVLELRWQYYFSDFIDGLNHKLPSNQNNDWAVSLNLGYVIYWER
jgi:hypothetical protein